MGTKVSSIFFCLFDNTNGPMVVYQDPEKAIEGEVFSSISDFVIPKEGFCNRLVKITSERKTYVGYPTMIKHGKYGRNALLFNLCFVFDEGTSDGAISCYEAIIKQINKELRILEINEDYIIKEEKRKGLGEIIKHLRNCLNTYGFCNIEFGNNIQMRVRLAIDPSNPIEEIRIDEVPVKVNELGAGEEDIGINEILPYINGERTGREIIEASHSCYEIVSEGLKQLVYGGYVVMIPKIEDKKRYECTKKILELYENERMLQTCIEYCKKYSIIKRSRMDIFRLVVGIEGKVTWKEYKEKKKESELDMNKLLKFMLVNKIVRATSTSKEWVEGMKEQTVLQKYE
ncbi:hypothetical protein ENUP19_0340G0049 [Entamoeba nuttalli]|uniref:Tumor suppressor candidate n=1 Tax=Entamoeba nuttalli TaxID=412467 RepID=A0ABQ0DXG8_9EUKA